jgi:hypothetical protein
VDEVKVRVEYKSSGAFIGYSFRCEGDHILIDVHSPYSNIFFHALLPEDSRATAVNIDGHETEFANERIEQSPYVNFLAETRGNSVIKIQWARNRRNS